MDIIKNSRLWFVFSGSLIVLAIAALSFNAFVRGKPLNFGIDFTGGTLLNLRFERPVTVAEVRGVLHEFKLGESVIQKSGETDILIRTVPLEGETRAGLISALNTKIAASEILEADIIGPTVGRELSAQAVWALIIASIGIIIYVSFRFEFKYAVTALFALYHDAIITTGLIALFWRTVDVGFVAAILTIMGYSINDTIVIYDRIRENLKKPGNAKKKFSEIVNASIYETLARSINTVLTVIIMVLLLLFLGGEPLRDFSLTLLIGFSFGAYSSIFVAPPLLNAWAKRENKK
ncbi:protein-export membrane protein SecF [candidate division WOR-1 bacterium RIFCSPHIGHO2_01_FULL_53_15]|uniref:Protein-export membrane protein SecF n=1 Tax=candidate division WOR-1 bacterium RIFCSPHIGHO2_01_FULL_53_15 TaxID=1802564 RepID=A0A1F4Q1H9_UNCSA|nr:MAG: protein-export membrane protein SecF [candidate division WOR-1 bacterium RIFCSPHIGHO2_01_FULL_53_15]OGC13790.1 MAG: protein-export membrane protein SecF [candidate division WOR-1 bacterium RIFCSPHIGHO2_02_FULL_53_26]